jgi:hypothetical protein
VAEGVGPEFKPWYHKKKKIKKERIIYQLSLLSTWATQWEPVWKKKSYLNHKWIQSEVEMRGLCQSFLVMGCLQTTVLLISASLVSMITDVGHQHTAWNSFFFFFFSGTGAWTQGFELAKLALYHLSHISSPFCSGCFRDMGGGSSQTICWSHPPK